MTTPIFIEGFETGQTTTTLGTGATIQGTTKRTGDYALRINVPGDNFGFQNMFRYDESIGGQAGSFDNATIYYRFYLYMSTLPGGAEYIFHSRQSASSTIKFSVAINSSGNLSAYDTSGSLLASGSATLSTSTWYRIEVKVGTGTNAPYEVKVDGTVDITGTSSNLTSNNNASFTFGRPSGRILNGALSYLMFIDDVRVDSDGYPGAGQIKRLDVTGVGAENAWLSSAGGAAVVADVNVLPFSLYSQYSYSNLTNAIAQTWTHESCSSAGISGTIAAIVCNGWFADSLGTSAVYLRIKQTGYSATNTSGNANVSTGGEQLGWLRTTDLGSNPWTTSTLDTIEAGAYSGTAAVNMFYGGTAIQVEYSTTPEIVYTVVPGRPG